MLQACRVTLFDACANYDLSIKYLSGLPTEPHVVQQSQTPVYESKNDEAPISKKILTRSN